MQTNKSIKAGERTQRWETRISDPIPGTTRHRRVHVVDEAGNLIADCAMKNLSRPTSRYPDEVRFAHLIAATLNAHRIFKVMEDWMNAGSAEIHFDTLMPNGDDENETIGTAIAQYLNKAEGK